MPGRRRRPERDRSEMRGGMLAGVSRVLVDGRNVQFALRRGLSAELPDAVLIAHLRAALDGLETRLVLDGHSAGGPHGRIAPSFTVEYSRQRDADSVIGDLVVEGTQALGPAGSDAILVVTDDRAVREHARRHGARVAGTEWLVSRVTRTRGATAAGVSPARPGASIGHARPPRSPRRSIDR